MSALTRRTGADEVAGKILAVDLRSPLRRFRLVASRRTGAASDALLSTTRKRCDELVCDAASFRIDFSRRRETFGERNSEWVVALRSRPSASAPRGPERNSTRLGDVLPALLVVVPFLPLLPTNSSLLLFLRRAPKRPRPSPNKLDEPSDALLSSHRRQCLNVLQFNAKPACFSPLERWDDVN